jgi:hypothetical protein
MPASRVLVAEDEDHTLIKIHLKLNFRRYETLNYAFSSMEGVNKAEKLKT